MATDNNTVFAAFEALQRAYDEFMAEIDSIHAQVRERRMNLPPTLGQTNTQSNG